MIRRKAVRYCRVPSTHVGVEICEEEQGNRPCFAEGAVRITNAFRLNKLCRDWFVCVIAHGASLHSRCSLSSPSPLTQTHDLVSLPFRFPRPPPNLIPLLLSFPPRTY